MPNNIKSKLVINGTGEQIFDVLAKYGTHHDAKPNEAFDGRIIYKNAQGQYGWFDEKTNTFERRDQPNFKGVPEGYQVDMEDSYFQFPDLNKIVPMPPEMNITAGTSTDYGIAVIKARNGDYSELDRIMDYAWVQRDSKIKDREDPINHLVTTGSANLEEGQTALDNIEKYGHRDWYKWSIANWGTKWNTYSCETEDDGTFIFETAWSGIAEMIEKISHEFPKIGFTYSWADEDFGYNVGRVEFLNGATEVYQPEGGSLEAQELALELRPYYRDEMVLVDGRYEWKDE